MSHQTKILFAYLVSVLLLFSSRAEAAFKAVLVEEFGKWSVGHYIDESDGLGACSIFYQFPKKLYFTLNSFYQSNISLRISSDDWKIPEGTERSIFLDVDRNTSLTVTVKRTSLNSMAASAFHSHLHYWQFVDALIKGKVLTIILPDGSDHKGSLTRSGEALKRFTECSNEWAGFSVSGKKPSSIETSGRASGDIASAPRQSTTTPKTPAAKAAKISSGTGVIVSHAGHIVTNRHVVENCKNIYARKISGISYATQLIAKSNTDDIALLKLPDSASSALIFIGPGIRQGANIFAYGFPLSGALASTGNFTTGNITALAGLRDDSRYLQISAPVQPGNSGGPLLDGAGNLIGIVTSKLNAKLVANHTGDIPQNVNFALKASIVANFLDSQAVNYTATNSTRDRPPADVAEAARNFTVQITCVE